MDFLKPRQRDRVPDRTQQPAHAGLQGLNLHGLRRSFSSLTEWLETPSGVVVQIQGHNATAGSHV